MDNKYVNAIEMVGVTKTFGSVIANKEVDLTIRKGEILSLLGENGSGKTSLMNMLAGIYYPDKGQIFVNGKEVVIKSPIDAYNNKIGMVHQHFKLIDLFTAADNIILGETEPPFNYKEKLDSLKEEKARLIEEYKETKQNQEIEGSVVEKRGKQKFTDDIKWKRFLMNLKISSLPLARLWHKIKFNWLPRKRGKKIQDFADKYGFEIDVNKKIYDMSVSEKQTVEIIKVLYRGADVLILDEPTAVLTPQEIEKLFDVLRGMRDSGKSIIIITHKLNEVMAISDRVSVLRKGEFVGTVNTSETNETQLTEMMVGEKVELDMGRTIPENVRRRLEVQGLSCRTRMGVLALDNVSFNVNSGEILGIAGISGSGQRELLEAIAGLQKIEQGAIQYYEPETEKIVDLRSKTPNQIKDLGVRLSFVPEDRLGMGLVGNMDLTDNMMLRSYSKGHSIFLDRKTPYKLAKTIVEELEVVTKDIKTPVRRLSGGNVQKILVGREISSAPTVIMAAYPVRGLDINSSYTIYNLLNRQKEKGVAVIFVGEDLDVLLGLSDRIMVICSGKVSGIVDARKTTKEKLGMLMTSIPNDIEIFDETVETYGKDLAVDINNVKEEGANV
ncbi:MAG: ABC transporter ATP-binding protein [Christensenellales bacterium]|jgi:simple sugar transport system ATP-binding protein|nr:ABC transporter ATP-binding protein [Clostridiales bacterium]